MFMKPSTALKIVVGNDNGSVGLVLGVDGLLRVSVCWDLRVGVGVGNGVCLVCGLSSILTDEIYRELGWGRGDVGGGDKGIGEKMYLGCNLGRKLEESVSIVFLLDLLSRKRKQMITKEW